MSIQSISSLAPGPVKPAPAQTAAILKTGTPNLQYVNSIDTRPLIPAVSRNDLQNFEHDFRYQRRQDGNLLALILWFIIIAIFTAIVLSLWNPPIVQKNDLNGNATGDLDPIKVILGALIISLIVIIIIYLIRSARGEKYN